MTTLAYLTLEPPGSVRHVMIWLHGLGASNDDFATLLPTSGLGPHHRVAFILPNAPIRSVSAYQGEQARAWYDIVDLQALEHEDLIGIQASAQALSEIIEQVHAQGIPYHRIWLGGYSQGGAQALWTGLTYPQALGGIVGLSTYMPLMAHINEKQTALNRNIPILLAHGQFDDVLPWPLHQLSRTFLEQRGFSLDCYAYPIGHSVCLEEMQVLKDWFSQKSEQEVLLHP